jgi:exopolysaccharide biosynthesis protein
LQKNTILGCPSHQFQAKYFVIENKVPNIKQQKQKQSKEEKSLDEKEIQKMCEFSQHIPRLSCVFLYDDNNNNPM